MVGGRAASPGLFVTLSPCPLLLAAEHGRAGHVCSVRSTSPYLSMPGLTCEIADRRLPGLQHVPWWHGRREAETSFLSQMTCVPNGASLSGIVMRL